MENDTHASPPTMQPQPSGPRFGGLGRRGATALTALGLTVGGMAGGYVISHAQTASPSAATSPSAVAPAVGGTNGAAAAPASPSDGSNPGAFHSNENATHEAGESAAREAQETAGQRPTAP